MTQIEEDVPGCDRDIALEWAIERVGSMSELARRIGVKPQAVSQWRRVPAERVLQVERATGGAVTRYHLRPDLYPLLD